MNYVFVCFEFLILYFFLSQKHDFKFKNLSRSLESFILSFPHKIIQVITSLSFAVIDCTVVCLLASTIFKICSELLFTRNVSWVLSHQNVASKFDTAY